MQRFLIASLLSTAAFVPGAAFAQGQSPECDRLVLFVEQNQGIELPSGMDVTRIRAWQTERNEAECTALYQQIAQQGGQQAQQGAQAGDSQDPNATPETQEGQQPADGANIVVQQPAPTVTVDQAAPQITVQQPQPTVSVRQPQPEIIVRQPAPTVTVDIPQPEIIIRMPQPEVTVQQAQPQVQVEQAQPQVQVVQPEQPQVQVQDAQAAQVQLVQPEGQANVQVERTGEPTVTYERAEPNVMINQAEGQPTVTVEQMDTAAAGQAGAQLRDSVDPNATPEAQEGGQQQATATQAGQQPAAGTQSGMQRVALSDLEGMDVVNERGEQMGEVEGVVRSAADNKSYIVIDHGGFLGLGEKRIALSVEGLAVRGDQLVVPGLTDEQIRALPEFEASDQFPRITDDAVEIRAMAQQ